MKAPENVPFRAALQGFVDAQSHDHDGVANVDHFAAHLLEHAGLLKQGPPPQSTGDSTTASR